MSRVGQGTGVSGGNRQSNQSRMGFERLVALFRHAYDRGITFFDTANVYGAGHSERVLGVLDALDRVLGEIEGDFALTVPTAKVRAASPWYPL